MQLERWHAVRVRLRALFVLLVVRLDRQDEVHEYEQREHQTRPVVAAGDQVRIVVRVVVELVGPPVPKAGVAVVRTGPRRQPARASRPKSKTWCAAK